MRVCEPKKQGAHNRNFRISEHTVHARALGFGRFFCRFLKFFFLILYIAYSAPRRDVRSAKMPFPSTAIHAAAGICRAEVFGFSARRFTPFGKTKQPTVICAPLSERELQEKGRFSTRRAGEFVLFAYFVFRFYRYTISCVDLMFHVKHQRQARAKRFHVKHFCGAYVNFFLILRRCG